MKMYQEQVEKPYTKKEINLLKRHFKELEKAGESPSVQRYVQKIKKQLKS